jgi:hypothetical protein
MQNLYENNKFVIYLLLLWSEHNMHSYVPSNKEYITDNIIYIN